MYHAYDAIQLRVQPYEQRIDTLILPTTEWWSVPVYYVGENDAEENKSCKENKSNSGSYLALIDFETESNEASANFKNFEIEFSRFDHDLLIQR